STIRGRRETAAMRDFCPVLCQLRVSDVLKVISSSPGEVEPVFQTILENATRICEAKFGVMQLSVSNGFRAVALRFQRAFRSLEALTSRPLMASMGNNRPNAVSENEPNGEPDYHRNGELQHHIR